MQPRNVYIWTGFGLLVSGSLMLVPSYFIFNLTWLSALSVCMLIMSVILIALGFTIPQLSPQVCSLLMETGIDNISTLVEELGLSSKAVYLPSSLTSERPCALIPLRGSDVPRVSGAVPRRLICRYGTGPDDVGLLVSTVGSSAVNMLESKPGPNSADMETSLTSLFSGQLGVADGASVVCRESQVEVTIHNPRVDHHNLWSNRSLGYPLASIAASLAAEAWDKPIAIKGERFDTNSYSVVLEVLN